MIICRDVSVIDMLGHRYSTMLKMCFCSCCFKLIYMCSIIKFLIRILVVNNCCFKLHFMSVSDNLRHRPFLFINFYAFHRKNNLVVRVCQMVASMFWMNEWGIYIALYCVFSNMGGGGGGLSWTTTSVQHLLGWYDGCHRTNGASALITHQLQVERRQSHGANQVDGDY